jgi:hypothetical protein
MWCYSNAGAKYAYRISFAENVVAVVLGEIRYEIEDTGEAGDMAGVISRLANCHGEW